MSNEVGDFHAPNTGPLKQGDILLGAVARIVGEDSFELIRVGVPPVEAEHQAEDDATLDRGLVVSPLIEPFDLGLDLGNLLSGKVVGYLPVPELRIGSESEPLIPSSVVDLGYRTTVDRTLRFQRIGCVSESARKQLRYALARMDSLRANQFGFELEQVLGKMITKVSVPKRDPLGVRLHLDDGTYIDLLQQPSEPEPGPSRSTAPSNSGVQ